MGKLKKALCSRRAEIVILVFLFLFSLRVINWFEYPYVMVTGDLRPPLVQEAFNKRIIYTWDETDFGMPSVYPPRILIPSYFFVTVFQNLGMDLFSSQLTAVFLMYFVACILMYVYVKQLTDGDIIAAFIAALFLTSNIYLVSDREQTAIGFIDTILMILPFLVAFTEGIKKKSYAMLTLSGVLFVLSYGAFPNYRTTFLCFVTAILTLLFIYMQNGLNVNHEKNRISGFLNISLNTDLMRDYLKYLIVSVLAVLLASIWIIVMVSANFHYLILSYGQMASTVSVLKYIQIHDILRLIGKWGFYSGAFGSPYVPYADVYLHNPLLIVLSYLPPILAFASVLAPKSRRLTVYFSAIAFLSLILVSAAIPELYSAFVSYFPLMIAFRESAQWLFFTILSYSILIGVVSSLLYHRFRKKVFQIITLSLVVILLFSSSYPLATGDVTRNWLDPNIKGSFFPNSYAELNDALSNKYWTLLLPQRATYVVYNFTEGPLACGNPYPLIFSKPIVTGTGTEYVSPSNLDLIGEIYGLIQTNIEGSDGVPKFLGMVGIEHLVLEKDMIFGNASSVNEVELTQNERLILAKEWDEIALINNTHALERFYVADNILNYSTLDEMYQVTKNTEWTTLQRSVFFNSTSAYYLADKALTLPENFVWEEPSPTNYEVHVKSAGAFLLAFLESYDEHWKVFVNGNPVSEKNHQEVNAFANCWLIDQTGDLAISIQYETQNLFLVSVVASLVLPALLLAFLSRKELKRIRCLLCHKLRSIKVNSKQKM
ncbi:MAG: hypothetical protein ABSG57_06130 [Candidatus Bathyarchaeia archaeon]